MNVCETLRPDLGAWLDDALSPEEAARMDAHVPTCAACREEVAALWALTQAISLLPDPTPSPRVRARVLAQVVAQTRPFQVETRSVERDGVRRVERRDSHLPPEPTPRAEPFSPRVVQYHRQVSADGNTILRQTSQTA